MALVRFKDAHPNYREEFGRDTNAAHFDEYTVYTQGQEKVGSVKDALFEDTTGNIRYLIVNTGFWFIGRDILLPIGLAHFDYNQKRIYVDGLTKEQTENLPEYRDNMTIDRDYENRVRSGYRNLGENRTHRFRGQEYNAVEYGAYPGSAALYGATGQYASSSSPVTETTDTDMLNTDVAGKRNTNIDTNDNDYDDYDRDPGLYAMDKGAHEPIRLYQERLIADKNRYKTGEVSVGKRIETEQQEVSVPVRNERIVVERSAPSDDRVSMVDAPDFREGEVTRVETYGEKANIRKEPFVREEVNVRKEADQDIVSERDTVRRETLDIDTEGNPDVVNH